MTDLESPFERDANWERPLRELNRHDAICEIKAHQNEVIFMIYNNMLMLKERVQTLEDELSKLNVENK